VDGRDLQGLAGWDATKERRETMTPAEIIALGIIGLAMLWIEKEGMK